MRTNSNGVNHLSTEQRALLALELMEGPTRWSVARAAAVVGLSKSYLYTAYNASNEDRQALCNGWVTLARLHNKRTRGRIVHPSKATDDEVEWIVRTIGSNRILHALDAPTAPAQAAE